MIKYRYKYKQFSTYFQIASMARWPLPQHPSIRILVTFELHQGRTIIFRNTKFDEPTLYSERAHDFGRMAAKERLGVGAEI